MTEETARERQQAARIRELLDQVEALEERLFQLESTMLSEVSPLRDLFTHHEALVLGLLMQRQIATKEQLMAALYNGRNDDEIAEEKIVDVYVCKIRRKLKPLGIAIETKWGVGYFLTAEAKVAIRMMGKHSELDGGTTAHKENEDA